MSGVLLKEFNNGILLLTLNRPDKKNALSFELWDALYEAIIEARENDNIRVVVLTGAGGNFCSGTDLTEFANTEREHPFTRCAKAIAAYDKPLIGAASGIAVGGGATMLFHTDVLYVGESLRMRLPFVNLALVPEFASSYMLQTAIGLRKAAKLFYTAEWIDAQKAENLGIANEVVEDENLLSTAMETATQIAQWPVNSLRETKKTLKLSHTSAIAAAFDAEEKGMAKQAGSSENREAIQAFIEKRKPNFEREK